MRSVYKKKNIIFIVLCQIILIFSGFTLCANSPIIENPKQSDIIQKKPKECTVRVLLDEKKYNGQWIIESASDLIICELGNEHKRKISSTKSHIFCFKDKNLFINGKKLSEKNIRVRSAQDHLLFNNNPYQGDLLFIVENDTCYLINQLRLEDYVYSVLRSESWPGWPLEVNKVFAIASRTYVLNKILERTNKKPFHIKNTNIHQTYNGYHNNELLKKAVEQTEGLIVTHNKKPILAMFDSCCGGVVPANLSGVDFKKSPYLARAQICDFCKPCKIYQWHFELSLLEFEKLLQKKGFDLYAIKDIEIKNDKAGSVLEVVIKWAKGVTRLTGKQFYALSTKIKSYCYSIEIKMKKILIKGKGYGHHCGICQWGARYMVDQGWTYRNILRFFYPGTSCMKLTV